MSRACGYIVEWRMKSISKSFGCTNDPCFAKTVLRCNTKNYAILRLISCRQRYKYLVSPASPGCSFCEGHTSMKTLNFLKKRYVALKSGSRRSRRVTGQRNVFNQLHQKYGDDFQKRNNVRILIDGKKQLAILLHSPARGEPYETLKSQCWERGVLQHTTCSTWCRTQSES